MKRHDTSTQQAYEPIILRLFNIAEKDQYLRLRQDPNIEVFDSIEGQLRELIKSNHPAIKIADKDYPEYISQHLGDTPMEEYGVWVYYPWSRRLVHLLDKEEFVAMRTNRNQYKITKEEQALLETKKIGVIGLSVGQSIALTLAMERVCGELRLADFDTAELTNLNRIGEGATRTAEIVKGLRIFSRLDEDDLKQANIHDGLDSTLVILNHQLGNYIKINKKYSELPLVECYPGKLNQVFLNIMTNAIHAINLRWNKQIGGELTVATRSDDNNAYISIQDNGIGMDEATQKKIFEPFFTTKEVGEGTGLGMSIAYNTIKKHNGYIELESTPGVGTTFTLVIPLVHVISKEVNAETTA